MPFPPPPPPPGPPAPTFGSAAPQTMNSDGDGRNLLLQSIRQGTTLKKTVTNDRSLPAIGKFQLIQGCLLGDGCSMCRSCVTGVIRLVL
jgi:hypothetical protein